MTPEIKQRIEQIRRGEVPEGYKRTRAGIVPEEWEEKRIGDVLTQRKTFDEVEVGNNIYAPMKRVRKKDDGTRNPISIVSASVPFTPSKSKTYSDTIDIRYHETQKPILLLEYLVKTYTNEGDLVLDFTCGSGSTGVACLNTNRRFVGIELEEKYFDIAKERLSKIS